MNTVRIFDSTEIKIAAKAIKEGKLVAFPTETVYGLGANLFDEKALAAIFAVKKRPKDNPLIIHIAELDWVHQIAVDIPEEFFLLAKHFFPGPLTVVLKKHPQISPLASAGLETIGIRMPSHPYALHLLKLAEVPIAAPSANLSGKPSPTCMEDVVEDLEGEIPYVIDGGNCDYGIESTVLDLRENFQILRPGSITKEALEEVLQKPVVYTKKTNKILCPGQKYQHYAPKAKISLFSSLTKLKDHLQKEKKQLVLCCKKELLKEDIPHWVVSAKNLYHFYREADRLHYEEILILHDKALEHDHGLWNRIELSKSFTF